MLDLRFDPERFELGCQALSPLAFLLSPLAFLLSPLAFLLSPLAFSLYERGHPAAVCIVKT
jgi:hypothetical protein